MAFGTSGRNDHAGIVGRPQRDATRLDRTASDTDALQFCLKICRSGLISRRDRNSFFFAIPL